MKSTILSVGAVLIAVNLLFGLLLSAYDPFNMWFNTTIIVITVVLLLLVQTLQFKDALKVSLTILLPISCLIKLLLGSFAPEHFEDNWCVIICGLITIIEILMIIIVNKISKNI